MVISKTSLRISVVIPVYNEAQHLAACLAAIANQTVAPYEVIVVDNNSTDQTVQIARQYSEFVRLLFEPRQGVVFARDTGFNAAGGDIIGRVDADTIIDANWIANIQQIFSTAAVDAISGSVHYYDVSYPEISGKLDLFFRQRLANKLGSEVFLYGANMAIRRNVWLKVRSSLCRQSGIHEDFDLAIHTQSIDKKVTFDKRLHAAVSLRRFDSGFLAFLSYIKLSPNTYALHGRTSQRSMYGILVVVVVFYWFILINHRGYNPQAAGLSWRRVWRSAILPRVNPATYID